MRIQIKEYIFQSRLLISPFPFPPVPSSTVDKSPPVSPGTSLRSVVFQAPLFFFLIHLAFLRLSMTFVLCLRSASIPKKRLSHERDCFQYLYLKELV